MRRMSGPSPAGNSGADPALSPATAPTSDMAPDRKTAFTPSPSPRAPALANIQGAFSALARQSSSMRQALALLIVVSTAAILAAGAVGPLAEETGALAPVPAQREPLNRGDDCLSPADLREAVAEKRVVAPIAAIRAARQIVPRAEIQRASLCRHEAGLVYLLTALRRDGQFMHVMVDAQSGQVSGQW